MEVTKKPQLERLGQRYHFFFFLMNEIIVVVREELHFGKGKMAKENEQGGHQIAISIFLYS